MREEPTRSLLLLDAERRRAPADLGDRRARRLERRRRGRRGDGASALLQGPHGREVRAALLGSWDARARARS